jgi:hypothetical protein
MDILYESLLTRLTNEVPELDWIDEDAGQLENPGESYPVQFPCVLINLQSIKWDSGLKGQQTGNAVISIRVAFKIEEDTHKGAPDIRIPLNRLKLVNKVHTALHGFGGFILPDTANVGQFTDSHFKRLVRSSTVAEKREDGLKVYQMDYLTNIKDVYATPALATHQVSTLEVTPEVNT